MGKTRQIAAFTLLLCISMIATLLSLPPLWQSSYAPLAQDPVQWQQGVDLINLNTATDAELRTLPGIGEKRAQSILAYRQTHGMFASVEQLVEVDGISSKAVQKFAHLVTVT